MTDLAQIASEGARADLRVLGGFHEGGETILMLGPDEPNGFWARFCESPEARDGQPNPMDRWSKRVITALADQFGVQAVFPFGGPPYHPFFTWALQTQRIHQSPVKFLVHDEAGRWDSFRGALRLSTRIEQPAPPAHPCEACVEKPCLTSCPVGAMSGDNYDVPACKSYLASDEGTTCMAAGCRVRATCPISQSWGRVDAQSAFHMAAFL